MTWYRSLFYLLDLKIIKNLTSIKDRNEMEAKEYIKLFGGYDLSDVKSKTYYCNYFLGVSSIIWNTFFCSTYKTE